MSKPLTVNDLFKLCQEEIKDGNGDHTIMISRDEEGNGYHYLYYEFTDARDLFNNDIEEAIMLGVDESISPIEKTIILG